MTTPAFTAESALWGHTSPETAFLVPDYPYGRKVRCRIRYWIETVPGKGDRFVSQTEKPGTTHWNAPKRSTYSPVGIMFTDEKGHVTWTVLSTWASAQAIETFKAVAGDNLLPHQAKALALVEALHKANAWVESRRLVAANS